MERTVGECFQWKIGQCSKRDSCSFSHDRASGNRCDQRRKGQSSSHQHPNKESNSATILNHALTILFPSNENFSHFVAMLYIFEEAVIKMIIKREAALQ